MALSSACRWLFLDFCPFCFAIILQVIWPSRYNLCSSQLYGPVVAISSFRFPPKIIGRTAESPLQHIQPAGCADFLEEGAQTSLLVPHCQIRYRKTNSETVTLSRVATKYQLICSLLKGKLRRLSLGKHLHNVRYCSIVLYYSAL